MIPVAAAGAPFQCPPACGWCCTHLERTPDREEARATREFRAMLRDLGVYHCGDAVTVGLSLSNEEARALREEAARRGVKARMHPRTYLLETRRRVAVVLDWHFPHVSCPFYEEYRCTVYEARPLVCRAFPVLGAAPAWRLAPQCPETEATLAAREAGRVRLGTYLRGENAARRAVEKASAAMDESAMRILDAPGARFATGLDPREAARRLKRYRLTSPAEFEALPPARSH